jgi:hypothetical protein
MTNKAQENAKRLINILLEGKLKRKKAPFIIFIILLIVVGSYLLGQSRFKNEKEKYYMTRTQYFNLNDFNSAKKDKIDLTSLGDKGNHILYFIGEYRYDLTLLKTMKSEGLDFMALNSEGHNTLEQILLDLPVSKASLAGPFQENIRALNSLGFKVQDETIRQISKKCEKNNPLTCIKAAFYFKEMNMKDHSASYAKRTCYKPVNEDLCNLAKDNF